MQDSYSFLDSNKIDTRKMQSAFNNYRIKYNSSSVSDIFFSFTIDETLQIEKYVYNKGYKDIYFNGISLFYKKQDMMQILSLEKIENYLKKENKNLFYLELKKFLFMGENVYYKPDIVIYIGYNEDTINDYYDLNCTNPAPDVIIELINIKDRAYMLNLILIYRDSGKYYDKMQVFFIDILHKEMFKLRVSENYLQAGNIEITPVMYAGDEYDEIYSSLIRMNYHGNLIMEGVKLNFEEIITKKD